MRIYSGEKFIKNGILSAKKKFYSGKGREHSHDFFEIEYIISGSGQYFVNGTEYTIKEGMLFFLSPANFHSISTERAELYNVMFPCSFFDPELMFSLFSPDYASAIELGAERTLIRSLLDEVVLSTKEDRFEDAGLYLQCILKKVSSLSSAEAHRPCSHISAAIIYILEHFRETITLKTTAEYLGLNISYLSSIFSKEMGKNFKTYVDELRFNYAEKLLSSTDIPITELCFKAGFSNYANFSRRFREKYGFSPKEMRRFPPLY